EVRIVRDEITLSDDLASKTIEEVRSADGRVAKVGVIEVPSFYLDMEGKHRGREDYASVSRDVRRLLGELEAEGVDAVVLDLRRNGGGSLSEAVAMTGLFIEKGPVVQVADPDGKRDVLVDPDPDIAWAGPLMVLTSPLSASASEIL